MPSSKVFCNTPWYELHIYWDGSLGICCQESHRLYSPGHESHYNVKNMTLAEWFNSLPAREFRKSMFDQQAPTACSRCHHEEALSGSSRRHRSNQKSVIFTKQNFADSYQQSPGFDKFEASKQNAGFHNGMPIDLHIDLGNFCNLTCKICDPQVSSSIAVQHVKWGIEQDRKYVGTDWTRDQEVWQRVLEELANIPKLHNIHFMGGETLLTRRFEQFVDFMIERKRTDLNFSFVTNGTTFNSSLMNKLKKFNRVGIEVSIETLTEHNAYQRQGTDTNEVLKNIQRYQEFCNNSSITVSIRPAVSALTIGQYWTLLEYCMTQGLIVKSLQVISPEYYNITVLPDAVKQQYLGHYQDLLQKYNTGLEQIQKDFNESDPNQAHLTVLREIVACIRALEAPAPADRDQLQQQMVEHCRRWDRVHGYDARQLYPEWKSMLDQYGY